eukprot:6008965-Pyramimonas_sp.AAC.1
MEWPAPREWLRPRPGPPVPGLHFPALPEPPAARRAVELRPGRPPPTQSLQGSPEPIGALPSSPHI